MSSGELEYTLESGPDEAPSCIDIWIPYTYRGGSPASYWEPEEPPEVEIDTAYYEVDGIEVKLELEPNFRDTVILDLICQKIGEERYDDWSDY